jgi:hypothetical protein
MIEARIHAVAVEFDFMQPLIAIRRGDVKLGELRLDPAGQRNRISAPRGINVGRQFVGDGSRLSRVPGFVRSKVRSAPRRRNY